jgi:hypothetical protein
MDLNKVNKNNIPANKMKMLSSIKCLISIRYIFRYLNPESFSKKIENSKKCEDNC